MTRLVRYHTIYTLPGGILEHGTVVPIKSSTTDEQAATWAREYCTKNGKEFVRVVKETREVIASA